AVNSAQKVLDGTGPARRHDIIAAEPRFLCMAFGRVPSHGMSPKLLIRLCSCHREGISVEQRSPILKIPSRVEKRMTNKAYNGQYQTDASFRRHLTRAPLAPNCF
ncbi:Uncharacterized protein BM_BM10000, partial [Brugia malayi]